MANQLQNIAQGMQAFGAGIQGNLPQFQRNQTLQKESQQKQEAIQQASEQAMMEGRTKSAYQDAEMALYHAEQGHFDKVIARGISRLQLLKQIEGSDPTDTQLLVQLALGAQNGEKGYAERLQSHLGGIVKDGQVREYLETPKTKDPFTDIGKLNDDLKSGKITKDQYDQQVSASKGGGTGDQRDRMIRDYMLVNPGSTYEEAVQAIDGKLVTDNITGQTATFNQYTGKSTPIEEDQTKSDEFNRNIPKITGDDLAFDPGEGTGAFASILGLWNDTLGQIPILPYAKNPEEAARNLTILERDSVKALSSSNRPPVVEQERIIAMMPKPMDFFQNPREAEAKTVGFIDLMMNQYVDDITFYSNTGNPKKLRESSLERSSNIESIVRRVLTPDAADLILESVHKTQQGGGDIADLSIDELLSTNPGDLTDDQLAAYIKLLSEGE